MGIYEFTILGLFFDLVGAFFLAVEAIKLQNFMKLRSYLEEVKDENVIATLARGIFRMIRGLSYSEFKKSYYKARSMRTWKLSVWTVGGFLAIAIIASFYAADIRSIPQLIIGLFIFLLLIRIVFLSGAGPEIKLIINFLEIIERKTLSGFIGVIGFIFLVVGFSIQAWVNILSIKPV